MPDLKGPTLELQEAMVSVWRASADVKALIGSSPRINPIQTEDWPGSYIEIGDGQELPDEAECIEGSELYFDVHIWSRADGNFSDVNKIGTALWAAIKTATITLTENTFVLIERSSFRRLRDPDGVTLHGVLTLRALTETA